MVHTETGAWRRPLIGRGANQEYWLIFPVDGEASFLTAWQPYNMLLFFLIFWDLKIVTVTERGRPPPSLELTVIRTHKPFRLSYYFLVFYIPMFYPQISSILSCIDKGKPRRKRSNCLCLCILILFFWLKPHSSFSSIAVFTFQSLWYRGWDCVQNVSFLSANCLCKYVLANILGSLYFAIVWRCWWFYCNF